MRTGLCRDTKNLGEPYEHILCPIARSVLLFISEHSGVNASFLGRLQLGGLAFFRLWVNTHIASNNIGSIYPTDPMKSSKSEDNQGPSKTHVQWDVDVGHACQDYVFDYYTT